MSVNVVQDKKAPIPKDVLATSICELSDSINKLLISGLNMNAIIVLLKEETGLSKRVITAVIESIGQLRELYTHG